MLRAHGRNEHRRLRVLGTVAIAAIAGAILISPANRAAIAESGSTVAARLEALEHKTQFMTSDTATMITRFSGCNLRVDDGAGKTDALAVNSDGDGLGNIIIGYGETASNRRNTHTGWHNLIVGTHNAYYSYGGIVAGYSNTIEAPFTTVSGGSYNTALGEYSSISGGAASVTYGMYSATSGGFGGFTYGAYSSISGGEGGTANGDYSSVSGGYLANITAECGWGGD